MEFQLLAFRMFLRVDRKRHTICFLRVLAVQELLAPLLAHALFLGCTVSCDLGCGWSLSLIYYVKNET